MNRDSSPRMLRCPPLPSPLSVWADWAASDMADILWRGNTNKQSGRSPAEATNILPLSHICVCATLEGFRFGIFYSAARAATGVAAWIVSLRLLGKSSFLSYSAGENFETKTAQRATKTFTFRHIWLLSTRSVPAESYQIMRVKRNKALKKKKKKGLSLRFT